MFKDMTYFAMLQYRPSDNYQVTPNQDSYVSVFRQIFVAPLSCEGQFKRKKKPASGQADHSGL
jgi:hypothetical protein